MCFPKTRSIAQEFLTLYVMFVFTGAVFTARYDYISDVTPVSRIQFLAFQIVVFACGAVGIYQLVKSIRKTIAP